MVVSAAFTDALSGQLPESSQDVQALAEADDTHGTGSAAESWGYVAAAADSDDGHRLLGLPRLPRTRALTEVRVRDALQQQPQQPKYEQQGGSMDADAMV